VSRSTEQIKHINVHLESRTSEYVKHINNKKNTEMYIWCPEQVKHVNTYLMYGVFN